MPPGAPAQQQQGDSSLGPFWIMAGLFALAWGIWYFAHEQIAAVVLRIRLVEAHFISLFTTHVQGLLTTIHHTSPATADFDTLVNISTAVGSYFRYPVAIVLGVLAIIIFFSHANTRYKKTYNMQHLVDEEKASWPQITPIAHLDLVNADIDKGSWAMAMSPMQFAKKYLLLQEERVVPTTSSLSQRTKTTVSLRREEAYQVFFLQVGRSWKGVERLSRHVQALFAVFAARISRDKDGASKLLQQIATSTATGKLNFSGVDELLAKHSNNKAVIKITQMHAFELTVMASMLLFARNDGVLAAADFLWLKPIDRSLWFMLNSVGRQVPFPEVAGPYAHWLAERQIGRKLSTPMVEEAVNALDLAIKDILYIPDEEG